ncbi:MAG: TetR/AcrR family transcriptional regulator [Thermoleophilia bacterium]|nr:TetR/AcrR family transcriptional regulator [Thermoleophilia bacterium]
MKNASIPLQDPTPNLSPTAGRLLEAARTILVRDGLSCVTYEAVAKESGETQSLIRYHFGDKAGLLRTLIVRELHLEARAILSTVSEEPPGVPRYHALLRECESIAREVEEYRAFLGVVATILLDPELRPLFRAFSDWYADLNRWVLAPIADDGSDADLDALATLTSAIAEGVALRYQAGPHVDVGAALRLWETMVCDYLARRCPESADSEGGRGSPSA